MGTTHALAGLLVGMAALVLAPGTGAGPVVLAGFLGGLAPDFDIYLAHRRTLHFPVYLPLATVLAVGLAAVVPATWTLALAVFIAAAALHSVADVLGGGLELRPWEATSDRGVYSHVHDGWLAPRRLVPYDGAPSDLALAGILGLSATLLVETTAPGARDLLAGLLAATLTVSIVYAVLRRRLPALAETLVRLVPDPFRPYVPERYRS